MRLPPVPEKFININVPLIGFWSLLVQNFCLFSAERQMFWVKLQSDSEWDSRFRIDWVRFMLSKRNLGLHRVWYSTCVIEYHCNITARTENRESSAHTLTHWNTLISINLLILSVIISFFSLFHFLELSASRPRQDRPNLFEPMDTCKISGSFEFLGHQ